MPIRRLLDESQVTDAFREAVAEFLSTPVSSDRISFGRGCPPVKVERTLAKILEEYPDLPVESIDLDAQSGCEFFRGVATIRAADGERRVRFEWNCRWRAEQMGWADWFGFPDQARAAREFGHDCFRAWEEEHATELAAD